MGRSPATEKLCFEVAGREFREECKALSVFTHLKDLRSWHGAKPRDREALLRGGRHGGNCSFAGN